MLLYSFILLLFPSALFAGPLTRSKATHSSSASTRHAAGTASTASNSAVPSPTPSSPSAVPPSSPCFPSLNHQMPSEVPGSLDNWWCPTDTEYAFMGFSYEISACQSPKQLNTEFADIRKNFNGRYVRLYGACDNKGFYNDIVEAAWNNGLGVHALIWFGFDGGDEWKKRRDELFDTLFTNPKAKFVTRVIQFGSEPLFDSAISVPDLTAQVISAKAKLAPLGIPVTVSELAYGYQKNNNAPGLLAAVDWMNVHMLPFFSTRATTGDMAWPLVEADMNWFIKHGGGKKMYFDENGWPSVTYSGVKPNSKTAVASVSSEQGYFQMLDDHCTDLKNAPGGGVGWFAHIYSDDQEPGYGIYNDKGVKKFPFQPRTSC